MICEKKSEFDEGETLDVHKVFFMNDLKIKFCNRFTGQLEPIIDPFDTGPCPNEDVMSAVQYLNNPIEVESILFDV